jgi:hypothetical protein
MTKEFSVSMIDLSCPKTRNLETKSRLKPILLNYPSILVVVVSRSQALLLVDQDEERN